MVQILYEATDSATRYGSFFLLIARTEGEDIVLNAFQKDVAAPVELRGRGIIAAELPPVELTPGGYSISAGIFDANHNFLEWLDNATRFDVLRIFTAGKPLISDWAC